MEQKQPESKKQTMLQLLKSMNAPAETKLLDEIKFKSEDDRRLFESLPLSPLQKERMLMDIYGLQEPAPESL